MHAHPIDTWHALARARNPAGLDALLADDAVFLSPIVHTPRRGKAIVKAYLAAALVVFGNASFRYVREIRGEHDAMLEFETEIDGVLVNGVDIVKWNDAGRIVEFEVMVRPLNLETAVGRARAGRHRPRWQGANRSDGVCHREDSQRRQRGRGRLDRVRSGLTRQVRSVVSASCCGAPHFERRRAVNCRF
jgi:hypothetical protein